MSHLKKCFTTRHALYKIFKLQLNRQQLNCNQSKTETQRCHELIIKERSLRESIETEAQNHFKNFAEYKAKTTQEITQLFARVRIAEEKAEQANDHDETIQQRNISVMEGNVLIQKRVDAIEKELNSIQESIFNGEVVAHRKPLSRESIVISPENDRPSASSQDQRKQATQEQKAFKKVKSSEIPLFLVILTLAAFKAVD